MIRSRTAVAAAVLVGLAAVLAAAPAEAVAAQNGAAPGTQPAASRPMPGQATSSQAIVAQPSPHQPSKGETRPSQPQPAGPGSESKPVEGTATPVKRPTKPTFEADPKELEVKPIDGKVKFNFHGQPWQGVLEWLASLSGLSLDWQELPGDHLNLRTQREYDLDEARDLINQHLLARGYTMLRHGEVLTVVNLSKLDPALVPQVSPQELDDRDAHEFVQTVFALDWLPAQTAEEELKPLLSPKGKLTKLTATNRLHAIDVVTNLRTVRDLLAEEQSGRGRERLVRSFKLKHARADDVKNLLEEFLGIEKKGNGSPMPLDPNQARMLQQQMQQMAQQQAQQVQPGAAKPKEAEIAIIANPRDNEVIAQAPPEAMAIIEQTIELLDAAPDPLNTLDRQLTRVRVFRLAQLDPETLVKLLHDMGGLSPQTKLTADKKNNSLLVNGPLVDHVVVQQVIERLDGSDRSFEVIRLRRLPADYVAGSIRFMMGEDEKKDDTNRNRYYFYDPFGSRSQPQEDNTRKFRVDADVENNRLLLWANDVELAEINKLLIKLGEVRPDDGRRSTVRILNLSDERATEFLRRLRENWSADETHPLLIEPAPPEAVDPFAPPTPTKSSAADTPAPASPDAQVAMTGDGTASERHLAGSPLVGPMEARAQVPQRQRPFVIPHQPSDAALVAFNNDTPETATDERRERESASPVTPPRQATPVKVTRAPDGRLVLSSEDSRALDAIEDLMYELAPPPKEYHIFRLKYPTTWAYGVVLNLQDFFGTDEKKNSTDDYWAGWYGFPRISSSETSDLQRLSKRKKLKFISDEDSRTILVQGATPEQLQIIGELIEVYDRPQSQNSGDLRITRLFKVKHAKAETIAEAIKDVYRDLLSSNDRALQNPHPHGDKQQPMAERSYTYVLGGGDKGKETPEAPIKFKGLLSVGIDKDSNTLVVSASQSLMEDLALLIDSLDAASKEKEAVSVVRSGGSAAVPRSLGGRLKEIFGDKIKIVGEGGPQVKDRPERTPQTARSR